MPRLHRLHILYGSGQQLLKVFRLARLGRLLRMLHYKIFDELKAMVLDEADRLLDMGFKKQIMSIFSVLEGKAAEGKPDVIIALTHIPGSQDRGTNLISGEELERVSKVKGIDAIIGGHSHQTIAGELNGVKVIQAYKTKLIEAMS